MPSVFIGLTTSSRNETGRFVLLGAYVDAVRAAGGIPILLPPGEPDLERLMRCLDGIIFTGGGDIDPALYGGLPHPTSYQINQERDTSELRLARLLFPETIPVLGICRGAQILAVAAEGDLIAHIPDVFGTAVAHRAHQEAPTEHIVHITPRSRLAHILRHSEIPVPSWHHQSIGRMPAGWRAVAHAPDNVIEAIEHEQHPWMIAVQWHPELARDSPVSQQLFQSFVDAARLQKADGEPEK